MHIVRLREPDGTVSFGALQEDETFVRRIDGDIYGEFDVTAETVTSFKLLAPIVPTQIIGVGLNYRRHASESGMVVPERPVIFLKSLNTVQNPGDPIILPRHLRSDEVDYECELAVVIGRPARNVSRATALSYVLGYTCANDVSARDWQLRLGGGQWCRGKMFDTFCPLGPVLVTADEIPDPQVLGIRTLLNGDAVQDWSTRDMVFDVATLIEFLSGSTTILPGTVILTGTPHGVGMAAKPPRWLSAGDLVTVEIARIGSLENPVQNES